MKKVLEQVAAWAVTAALVVVIVWFVWALAFAPDTEPKPNCTLPNGDRVYVDYGPHGDIEAPPNPDACREAITDYYEAQREG